MDSKNIRITDWRPLPKNSLLGFAQVEFPSGLIISDVTILTGDRGLWASPPSKPMRVAHPEMFDHSPQGGDR